LQNTESKLKVEHVKNGWTSKIQIETIYSNVQKNWITTRSNNP
jgi:hypothetical protein